MNCAGRRLAAACYSCLGRPVPCRAVLLMQAATARPQHRPCCVTATRLLLPQVLELSETNVTGPLPPEWGDGSRKLQKLLLNNVGFIDATLPAEWSCLGYVQSGSRHAHARTRAQKGLFRLLDADAADASVVSRYVALTTCSSPEGFGARMLSPPGAMGRTGCRPTGSSRLIGGLDCAAGSSQALGAGVGV